MFVLPPLTVSGAPEKPTSITNTQRRGSAAGALDVSTTSSPLFFLCSSASLSSLLPPGASLSRIPTCIHPPQCTKGTENQQSGSPERRTAFLTVPGQSTLLPVHPPSLPSTQLCRPSCLPIPPRARNRDGSMQTHDTHTRTHEHHKREGERGTDRGPKGKKREREGTRTRFFLFFPVERHGDRLTGHVIATTKTSPPLLN